MSTPPPDPKEAAKKELTNAVVWAALAAALAVFMFAYSGQMAEKKNFYLLGGAVAAVVAAVNGYSAYTLYEKSKKIK